MNKKILLVIIHVLKEKCAENIGKFEKVWNSYCLFCKWNIIPFPPGGQWVGEISRTQYLGAWVWVTEDLICLLLINMTDKGLSFS